MAYGIVRSQKCLLFQIRGEKKAIAKEAKKEMLNISPAQIHKRLARGLADSCNEL